MDFKDKIQDWIEKEEWKILRHDLLTREAFQLAELIEGLPEEEDIIVFRLLPRELAKDTFQLLSHDKQEQLIEALAQQSHRLSNLLNDLDPDDRTAFLEELPGRITQRLIQLLSPEERKIATTLLGYPEDSIGRLMTPEFVAVKPGYTVEQTLDHIRQYGRDSETFNVVYVVDDEWKLLDDMRLREILMAGPGQKIQDLMDHRCISLAATDDQETAIRAFQKHDRIALPVTDTQGMLVGIVTVDDVMDVAEEESTEDFQKFGSFQDTIVNPLKARITVLYKSRVMWLSVLVFMNVFSGAALARFEMTIQAKVSLMFFLPLLIASGGNAGAQSATLMIRSLATGQVILRNWLQLVGREVLVSFLLGVTMAAAVSLIAVLRAPEIIVVVCATMTITVMVGSLVGLLLPFIFTKLKLDPATASAPLITSIADIFGVIIYFSIASWYLDLL